MTTTTPAGPATTAGPAPAQRTLRSGKARKRLEIALFAGPALVVFLTFVILPVSNLLDIVRTALSWNDTPAEKED